MNTKKINEIDGGLELRKKILFYGGIFCFIVYLSMDIIGGIITPGYSYLIHAVSELTQAGAEYRLLLSPFLFVSAIMGILFGIGIVSNFKYTQNRLLFLGGILIIISGILTSFTGAIFPQDPINGDTTFAGTMHLILVGISAILVFPIILMIGIGLYREKQWKSFRLYSIITVLIVVIFGGLTPVLMMNDIELLGLFERIVIYAYLLWVFVIAFRFIREQPSQESNYEGRKKV